MIYSAILIFSILFFIQSERILDFKVFFVSSILYLICFGVFPIVYYLIDIPYYYNKGWLRFITISTDNSYYFSLASLLSLVGYLIFVFSYKISSFKSRFLVRYKARQINLIYYLSVFFLLFGILSFLIYLSSLGSIYQSFFINNRLAFEDDKVDVQSSVSFLRLFSKIILTSSYFLWALMKIKNTSASKFFFYLAFFCSFLYLFYSSGRLSLITYLFTFVVADSIVKGQIPYFKIAVATGIAGFITLFGKSLFRIFIYEDALEGSYERMEQDSFMIPFLDFIGEFSFPFLSFVRALDIESGWLYFKDMIFWFTYALPARFFPIIESTSLQNTKNLLGETSVVAEVPSDILSYGYLNFGVIGFLLIPYFFGYICKWVDAFKKDAKNPISTILTVALVFIIGFRVMYFDPKHLFKGSFYFYFVLLVIVGALYFNRRIKVR